MENMYSKKEVSKHMHDFIKNELTLKYGFAQSLKKNRLVRVREHYLDIIWYDKAPSGTRYHMEVHPLYSFYDGYFAFCSFLFPLEYSLDDGKKKGAWWEIKVIDENYNYFYPIEEFEKVCENAIKPYIEHSIIPYFNSITFDEDNSFDNFINICKRGCTIDETFDYEGIRNGHGLRYRNYGSKAMLYYTVLFNKIILLTRSNVEGFLEIKSEINNVIKLLADEDAGSKERGFSEDFTIDIGNLKSILSIFESQDADLINILKSKILEIEKDFMQNYHGVTLDENGNTIKFKKPRKKKI